ncbi:ferritin-like domain-containing protein [Streptosporangiaceae bacterium NEAU-GS5]|nr:ferritin-like domain-containing protein [Streptosporangiaceae bacterium NEAU-GS5]
MTTPTTYPNASAAASAGSPLGKALAAEHAAVYAYGVVGAQTTGTLRKRAATGFDAHRARRDQLRALLVKRGEAPAEPAPTYPLPFEVASPADAIRLAVLVEDGVTAAYLELAADPDLSLRRLAALAMQESAVRSYTWRPVVVAFPGMPVERATGPDPVRTEPTPIPPVVDTPAAQSPISQQLQDQ